MWGKVFIPPTVFRGVLAARNMEKAPAFYLKTEASMLALRKVGAVIQFMTLRISSFTSSVGLLSWSSLFLHWIRALTNSRRSKSVKDSLTFCFRRNISITPHSHTRP